METIIDILGISPEVGKTSGKEYFKIKTNAGSMTCFEEDVIKELKKCYAEDKSAKVEVIENEKDGRTFRNIRGFIGVSDVKASPVEVVKPENAFKDASNQLKKSQELYKSTTMYTSYAKDVFITMLEQVKNANAETAPKGDLAKIMMERAIELVKQARDAFS